MTAGIANPLGYLSVYDGGNPRALPGLAGTNLSGGTFVYFSGAVDNVSSGLTSYSVADTIILGDAAGSAFNGMLLQDTGSNTYGTVVTKGVVITLADGTVTAGNLVTLSSPNNAVRNSAGSFSPLNFPIGRALSSAGSETYALVQLGL